MYFRMSDNRAAAATVESLRVLEQDLNILTLVSVSGPGEFYSTSILDIFTHVASVMRFRL